MALLELIEKGADADLVRELLAHASEWLMAAKVGRLTGATAGSGARSGSTIVTGIASGRERRSRRGTRAGRIEHAIPKQRQD